jgi:hypothetical protein
VTAPYIPVFDMLDCERELDETDVSVDSECECECSEYRTSHTNTEDPIVGDMQTTYDMRKDCGLVEHFISSNS